MRSVLVLTFLILGTSFMAKAQSLQPVEVELNSLRIIDQRELGNRRFELTLEFSIAASDCVEEFIGLVRNNENNFVPVARIGDFCQKPLFGQTKTATIEVGIYTKSLPAREILKLGQKELWLEEDFGQVQIAN